MNPVLTNGPFGPNVVSMSIGRPLQFDPEAALDCAMRLFWRKGYESSSLQELISAMGLSKSSFYQAFNSKHALFERCIERYHQLLTGEMSTRLNRADHGKAFIRELFHSVANETEGRDARRGCLLMNTASEFAQSDGRISKLVSTSIAALVEIFESAITQAQQQHEIPADKNARELANYLVSSMSGLKNMVKAGADRETILQVADVVLGSLD